MRRGKNIKPQRVLLTLFENHSPDPASILLDALKVDGV
jgi:hypothetical protein